MQAGFSMMDLLFHPAAAILSAALVLACGGALLFLRRKIGVALRVAAVVLLCACALHLGLLGWLTVGFGSAKPQGEPQPQPAAVLYTQR